MKWRWWRRSDSNGAEANAAHEAAQEQKDKARAWTAQVDRTVRAADELARRSDRFAREVDRFARDIERSWRLRGSP